MQHYPRNALSPSYKSETKVEVVKKRNRASWIKKSPGCSNELQKASHSCHVVFEQNFETTQLKSSPQTGKLISWTFVCFGSNFRTNKNGKSTVLLPRIRAIFASLNQRVRNALAREFIKELRFHHFPWTQSAVHQPDVELKHCSTACNLHFYVSAKERRKKMNFLIWTPTRAPLSFSRDNFCFYRENFICVSAAFGSVLFLPCCSSLCAERALAPERDAKVGSRWKEKFYGAFFNQRSQIMLLLKRFPFYYRRCRGESSIKFQITWKRQQSRN